MLPTSLNGNWLLEVSPSPWLHLLLPERKSVNTPSFAPLRRRVFHFSSFVRGRNVRRLVIALFIWRASVSRCSPAIILPINTYHIYILSCTYISYRDCYRNRSIIIYYRPTERPSLQRARRGPLVCHYCVVCDFRVVRIPPYGAKGRKTRHRSVDQSIQCVKIP